MRNFLFFLLVVQLLIGCKSVLKSVKGIKNPKLETYSTTKKYLSKNDIDSTRVVYYKSLISYKVASQKKYLQIPNAFFFDGNGNSVDYRKTSADCNAKVGDFIEDLNAFHQVKKDSIRTLYELKSLLVSPNKHLLEEKPTDITVFITWAKYAGSLNKEKAFGWVKLLEQAKQRGVSVKYYLVNCDFQENWNLNEEQKSDLGLR